MNNNLSRILLSLSILLGLSSNALSQDCGELPQAPALVDGASATIDQLVANSREVKSFIELADVYLDCSLAFRKTVAFKDLGRDEKDAIEQTASALLDTRNAIGDDFNAQANAYKTANP